MKFEVTDLLLAMSGLHYSTRAPSMGAFLAWSDAISLRPHQFVFPPSHVTGRDLIQYAC